MKVSYDEMIRPHKKDEGRTADEIINDFKDRLNRLN